MPRKKMLIITEDDPGLQDIFRLILEKKGYEVAIFANPADFLNRRIRKPDLYILDKQLSGIDGLDVCRQLKMDNKTKNTPVIMVSANPNIGQLAREAGADDYVEKPFDLKHFLQVVEFHLSERDAV